MMNVGRFDCPDDIVPCLANEAGRKFQFPAGKKKQKTNEMCKYENRSNKFTHTVSIYHQIQFNWIWLTEYYQIQNIILFHIMRKYENQNELIEYYMN